MGAEEYEPQQQQHNQFAHAAVLILLRNILPIHVALLLLRLCCLQGQA